jgi:hypothetical protein
LCSCDEAAERFWLTPAQQDVMAHEHGEDASPWFFAGVLLPCSSCCFVLAAVCVRTTANPAATGEYILAACMQVGLPRCPASPQ